MENTIENKLARINEWLEVTEDYILLVSENEKLKINDIFFDVSTNKIYTFLELSSFKNIFSRIPLGVYISDNYRHNPFNCKKILAYYPRKINSEELPVDNLFKVIFREKYIDKYLKYKGWEKGKTGMFDFNGLKTLLNDFLMFK